MQKFGFILLSVAAMNAHAVTSAHYSMALVKNYLEPVVEAKISEIVGENAKLVNFQHNLLRGKFSTGEHSFAEFFGEVDATYDDADFAERYIQVQCGFFAETQVVPFAKQTVPVLEEEVNQTQLILSEIEISCSKK